MADVNWGIQKFQQPNQLNIQPGIQNYFQGQANQRANQQAQQQAQRAQIEQAQVKQAQLKQKTINDLMKQSQKITPEGVTMDKPKFIQGLYQAGYGQDAQAYEYQQYQQDTQKQKDFMNNFEMKREAERSMFKDTEGMMEAVVDKDPKEAAKLLKLTYAKWKMDASGIADEITREQFDAMKLSMEEDFAGQGQFLNTDAGILFGDKRSGTTRTLINPETNKPYMPSFAPKAGKVIETAGGQTLVEPVGGKPISQYGPKPATTIAQAKLDLDEERSGREFEKPNLTIGEEAIDREFGKDYAKFVTGGFADAVKGVDQMNGAVSELKAGKHNYTGPVLSKNPKWGREMTHQPSVDLQERVEDLVQRNLRVILGAQFTEEEGKRLIARAYNISLDEKINAKRLERLAKQMNDALQAKKQAADYFNKNGTLKGFPMPLITSQSQFNLSGSQPITKKPIGTKSTKKRRKATAEDF